jgi:hypothetical protein
VIAATFVVGSVAAASAPSRPNVSARSPIPFKVGNRWSYRIAYADPVGTVIYTQKVTKIAPGEDDVEVTLDTSYHFENGSQPDFAFDVLYGVKPSGALTVPLNAFAIGDVRFLNRGTSGAVVWPSLPGIRAGKRSTGDFSATIEVPQVGQVNADYHYDISGGGTDAVTVEAGSFPHAALMNVTIDITTDIPAAGPIEQTVTARLWFAKGVGLLLHEAQGGTAPGTVTELVSTNVKPGNRARSRS